MKKNSAALNFSQMLLALLKGKTSLPDALRILARDGMESPVKNCAAALLALMKKGKNFSGSLRSPENNAVYFEPLYLSLLTAAEATGAIDNMLEHIVKDLQRKQKAKENVVNVLIYPSIIILVAIAGTIVIIVKGLPLFIQAGFLTGAVIGEAVTGVISAGTVLLAGGGLFFFCCYRIFYCDSPVYNLFYILSFMMQNNISLPEALSYCIMSVKSKKYVKALIMIKKDIAAGISFSAAFANTASFSPYVLGWLSVADINGSVTEACGNIKDYYEQKDEKIRALAVRLLEPAVILLTGIYILIIMLTVVLPVLTYAGGIL